MTLDEIVTAFQTPITTFKNGAVIQKVLLDSGAISNPELATRRCLSLLESTELRPIFLSLYPEFKINDALLVDVTSISEMKEALVPYIKITKRAIDELGIQFPLETLDLLKDYLVKESPRYFVIVNIFIVNAMILIEAGEI